MCETYNERGIEHASIMDLGTGGWNFLLVAVGGTVIGSTKKKIDYLLGAAVVVGVYYLHFCCC